MIFVKRYPEQTLENYVAVLSDLGVDAYSEHNLDVTVKHGHDSPYVFGQKMRQAIEDESAEIYFTNGVHWAVNDSGDVSFFKSSCIGAAEIPEGATLV